MTNHILDHIKAILGTATDRYAESYEAGVRDTLAALSEFVAARRGAPPEAAVAGASADAPRRRRRRRKLTPTEARILDFVAANPGCTLADLKGQGVVTSPSPVYALVACRKLRRTEDPKPHTYGRPWVHFHPMEPRNNG